MALAAASLAWAACSRDAPPQSPDRAGVPAQHAPAQDAAARATPTLTPTRLALWLPCEGSVRVLEHPERIDDLLDHAAALGATDLFVQVFRGGRAWYETELADAEPYRQARQDSGIDPLAVLLTRAGEAGLRVHAWINALSLSTRRGGPLFDRLGRGAIQVDQRGRSVLDYPELELPEPERRYLRMGTRQVWLDPGVPEVADALEEIVADLFLRYPALSGLHLDYIRYPDVLPFSPGSRFGVGVDFGYGDRSRARFERETGLKSPFGQSLANANRWDDWRRERVTEVVRRASDAARTARPDVEVSAAVWAYANRAYLSLFQDWRRWLEAGWIDFAVPMAYTRDDRLLRYLAHETTGGVEGGRVWLGLGAWLFAKSPERARAQLDFARSLQPAGVSLFSYDALRDAPALLSALEKP